jgi:hypothetical protein
LTTDGLSDVRLNTKDGTASLDLVPFLAEPPAFAGSKTFFSDYPFLRDVDGDGVLDAVIPTPGGIAIHPKLAEAASYRARLPGDVRHDDASGAERTFPIPEFLDVDGDKVRDLVVRDLSATPQRVAVARGAKEGTFGPATWINLGCLEAPPRPTPTPKKKDEGDDDEGASEESKRVAWFGDLDGDGRAEVVTREGLDTKSGMKQAKKPRMRYAVYKLRPDLIVDPQPKQSFEAEGYAFSGAFQDGVDLDFLDLDGDGRKDLVTVTLDFSIFQALRVLTAKKIGIGLEFHVLSQKPDGAFAMVTDQTLDEKLRLDLDHLEISRLGQFRGDFDGDGRIDFVHLGGGRASRSIAGCPAAATRRSRTWRSRSTRSRRTSCSSGSPTSTAMAGPTSGSRARWRRGTRGPRHRSARAAPFRGSRSDRLRVILAAAAAATPPAPGAVVEKLADATRTTDVRRSRPRSHRGGKGENRGSILVLVGPPRKEEGREPLRDRARHRGEAEARGEAFRWDPEHRRRSSLSAAIFLWGRSTPRISTATEPTRSSSTRSPGSTSSSSTGRPRHDGARARRGSARPPSGRRRRGPRASRRFLRFDDDYRRGTTPALRR